MHDYDARDSAARDALVGKAHAEFCAAPARSPYCPAINIPSFSHALGTVRLGTDPRTSPLDGNRAHFAGIEQPVRDGRQRAAPSRPASIHR